MLRRYGLPSALIMVISLAAGGLASAGTSETVHSARCVFQVFVRLSRDITQTPDYQKFIAGLALQQVDTAFASGLYRQVATHEKVNAVSLARNAETRPTPGLGTFSVSVADSDPKRAIRLANATCDQFVATIKMQRATAIDAQTKRIQDRIASIQAEAKRLEAIPAKKRTAAQNASLQAQKTAIVFNSALIANVISLPPDDISVLARATGTERRETGSLSKNMLIAIIGGLLACFLYILVGEVLAERRPGSGHVSG